MGAAAELFVTGVTGSIGRKVAAAALERGVAVRGFAQPHEDVGALAALGVEIRRGTIEDVSALGAAAAGTTHAVHCAALLPSPAHLDKAAFQRVNVDGARAMARLARALRWKRAVFVSTCGVLGREKDGPTTDDTAYRKPHEHYTWSKIEAEKAVLEETRLGGVASVILRPANVYGPGMAFKWPDLFELVRDGKMKMIGGGRAPFCVVHVRDLVRAVFAALDESRPLQPGERILVSSGEQLSFSEVVGTVAEALQAPRAGSVPYPLALGAALFACALPPQLRFGRLKLLSPAVVREYRQGFRFDTAHAERALGFRAQERFRPAIAEAIAAWQGPS